MPDDLVGAVGKQCIGHKAHIGHLLLLLIGALTTPLLPAVDAGEGLRGNHVATRQGSRRGGDTAVVGLIEDSLGLGHIYCHEGRQQVGRRTATLRAREGTLRVSILGEGTVELVDDVVGHQRHIVVVNILIASLVEVVHIGLDLIAESLLELLAEALGP